jgi:hypothetical protein
MPTVFSLSMLDVLCCGLGAVIFLMILYSWDARRQSHALAAARARIEKTSEDLGAKERSLASIEDELRATRAALVDAEAMIKKAQNELASARQINAELVSKLGEAEGELSRRAQRIVGAEAERSKLERALALKSEEQLATQAELASVLQSLQRERRQRTAAEQLADLLPELRSQLSVVERRARQMEVEAAEQRRTLLSLQERLAATEKERGELALQAANLPKLRDQLATANRRLQELDASLSTVEKSRVEALARASALEKQAAAAREEVKLLRAQLSEKEASAGALKRQLVEAEGRFAGIDLSGKRVVLLVDMSGSMGLSQGDRADPNKWPEVSRTVGQVLGSLNHAERFQLIVFSDRLLQPLGRPGDWLEYDPNRSPREVQEALLKIKPTGDTNLYLGFEAAFHYKAQGLDTIYLFSDGLPNTGPGLPNPPPRDETAVANALGRHLRDRLNNQWNAGASKVRIHSIGFFYDSPNLGAFLWTLSRENGGSFVGMNRP